MITKVRAFSCCSKCLLTFHQVSGSELAPVPLDLATKQATSIEDVRVLQKSDAFEMEYLTKLDDETAAW